jgi:hypothetical protein
MYSKDFHKAANRHKAEIRYKKGSVVDVHSDGKATPHIVKHVWTEGGKVSSYGVYPAEGKSKRFYNVFAEHVTKHKTGK